MMDILDLSGQWQVFLDPEDQGIAKKWYQSENLQSMKGLNITLPGSLEQAGIGDPVTNQTHWIGSQFGTEFTEDPLYAPYRGNDSFRFPYWLQPETRFLGPAWYGKWITLPKQEGLHHWQLVLERPHWETQVWIDGTYLGRCDSLSVPHRYQLDCSEERTVQVVIRVDNRMIWDVGPNAHSISDQTQGPWNGIVGTMALVPVAEISLGTVSSYPDIPRRSILVRLEVKNHTSLARKCIIAVNEGAQRLASLSCVMEKETTICNLEVELPNLALWDEFEPHLANLEVSLFDHEDHFFDRKGFQVGLRDVSTQGNHLFINQKQIFLRGTVECCVFPKTGAPPMLENEWEFLFIQSKAFGLNHIRFHSWCPPEAAFRVADRMGFYLQIECPIWKNQGVAYDSNTAFDNWLFAESERIVVEYGNHPSFLLFASGNEPEGRYDKILGLWTSSWRQRDGRRLYTAASGWPALEENEYHVIPEPRIQAWGDGLKSRLNSKPPETYSDYKAICENYSVPVVTHEMGQWCVFPDFSEIKEYTGYLKPRNFEIFADILARRGLTGQAKDFLYASGRQQVLCYKEELEAAFRTGNLSGFQLLALTDFPGQGTALEGVLNVFYQEKGYCSSGEFNRFCNATVLLARLQKRYYHYGEMCKVLIELSHYGRTVLQKVAVTWKLCSEEGIQFEGGTVECDRVLERGLHSISELSLSLPVLDRAQKLTFFLSMDDPKCENQWDIWVFSQDVVLDAGDVLIIREWDDEAHKALHEGRNVLLLASSEAVDTDVELGFSSVFWNTSWTNGQAPHTLGLLCQAEHPVFADFPTEGHADWQWWELVHQARAMVLDSLPQELMPLVQPIDTWFRSHKLGLLFECMVGKGKLMVSSMDMTTDLDNRRVARQLLHSILSYMQSDGFVPVCRLSEDAVGTLFSVKE